jgi:molecular chaperone HtpG
MAQQRNLSPEKWSYAGEISGRGSQCLLEFLERLWALRKTDVAIEQTDPEALYPLLRFHTTTHPEVLSSLDEYIKRMKPDQPAIYYILGDDERSILFSPHLDIVRKHDYEVLLFADPLDPFYLSQRISGHPLTNAAQADLKLPTTSEEVNQSQNRFRRD